MGHQSNFMSILDKLLKVKKGNDMEKIKLYLHIGIHKTGTTAIQHFLKINNKALKKNGIYLPIEYFSDNRPQDLVFKMINNNFKYIEILENMKAVCISDKCHSIILSNEDMVGMRNTDVVKILNELFDLKVLIYLRRQDKYIESNYSFFTTLFESRYSYKKPIHEIPPMSTISNYYCDLIDVYSGIVDKANIFIKIYDEIARKDNLLGSFLEIFDLDLNEKFIVGDDIKNVSPNKYVVEFMASIDDGLNDRAKYYDIFYWLKTESIIKNGPKPIFFTKNDRVELMNKCRKCNEKISNKYFGGRSIFDDDYDTEVPKSITKETIETIIIDIKKKFNIEFKPMSAYTKEQKKALEKGS
jgi:hypothetical protein